MSLATIFWIVVILAVVGTATLGTFLFLTSNKKAQVEGRLKGLETKLAQDEVKRREVEQSAKLALTRTRQEELLGHARNATNLLGNLLVATRNVAMVSEALKTNDVGRRIAGHPDLVAQGRRLYQNELPALASESEVIGKLEGARRIEQQMVSSLGTLYEPATEFFVTAQNAAVWSEQEQRRVVAVKAFLSALVQESKVKVGDDSSASGAPTLNAAIAELNQAEAEARQKAILRKTSEATGQATEMLANKQAELIIQEAHLQASNILAQVKEASAKQEREQMLKQAESKMEDTKARVAAQTKEEEARNLELRKKASGPGVQAKLAPFVTPGNMQIFKRTYDLKPVSYTALQSHGALDQSIPGLRKLAEIGCTLRDKIRPRWKLKGGASGFTLYPDEIEKVKEAQQLLIELGPMLVEMKLLEP